MASVGDVIRYGQSGLCRLTEIREMTVAKEKKKYFVLEPMYRAGSTVFVPCDNPELVKKMQPPLTEREWETLLVRAEETTVLWNRDFRRRMEESKRDLASGDPERILLLLKSIALHKNLEEEKRVHTTDDFYRKEAEALLVGELAYVKGISPAEAALLFKERLSFL